MTHEAAEIAKLAEVVEAASAEHADLFGEAYRACFPKPTRIWEDEDREEWTAEYSQHHERSWAFEAFLDARAHLDAAMSLVPEGWKIHCIGESEYVVDLSRPWLAMVVKKGADLDAGHTCYAATPALALTAAALRARAILSEKGEHK